ncbi:MAG: hypothetical protein WCV67_12955 [Victivallaceae bacterium]
MKTECRKRDLRKPFRIRLSRLRAQSRKTWGQWGLWVLWGLWGVSPANAGREMIVQNGFGVVPSVSHGVVQNRTVARSVLLAGGCPAQSRKTWGQWGLWVLWGLWGALSPANAGREMTVQNGFVVVPSVPDGAVQNRAVARRRAVKHGSYGSYGSYGAYGERCLPLMREGR